MSDEQLVRMGRTDLYRRGDTEEVNGRRVAKPGAEPVTVLTTTLGSVHPCAYQYDRMIWRVDHDGWYWERGTVSDSDLVAIDPAPKLVPWGFGEVPWDHWFRVEHGFVCKRIAATDNTTSRVFFDEYGWVSLPELLAQHEHSTTPLGPFEPCGKYES